MKMRGFCLPGVLAVFFGGISVCLAQGSQISYTATDLGGGSWQYNYSVTNLGLSQPIRSFTVWFDYEVCSDLTITTPDPPGANWDEMIFPEDDVLGDGPGYDALALSAGIALGQTVSGFTVTFDWFGLDNPGSQFYQIFDPDNHFAFVDEGATVPEPASALLFSIAGIFMHKRYDSQQRRQRQKFRPTVIGGRNRQFLSSSLTFDGIVNKGKEW